VNGKYPGCNPKKQQDFSSAHVEVQEIPFAWRLWAKDVINNLFISPHPFMGEFLISFPMT